MNRPTYMQEIRRRIEAAKNGSVFVASDFADITETKRISEYLVRLSADNTVICVMRGVFYKPKYSKLLDEYIAPSPDAVAHALARNYGWTIFPCGDTALNLLGLSTQVPVVWSYVSDGPYKEYSYDNATIKYKHTTNKEVSKLSPNLMVEDYWKTLDDTEKKIYRLREQGYTQGEVAKMLGYSGNSAVSKRLKTMRAKFKDVTGI